MDSPASTDDGAPDIVVPALVPGTMVADRYRIQTRLGAGGGGAVWRCHDEKLDAVVALKVINPTGDLERWRREVAMARRIADRNVCRVHDLGEAGDLKFVTMELVEGDSLRNRLSPQMPAETARELFGQIVSGAAAIHAAGIVHRDLKPDNIVVDRTGRAVIVDFGLARSPRIVVTPRSDPPDRKLESNPKVTVRMRGSRPVAERARPASSRPELTDDGAIVGTPQYMSPEQAAGYPVDARADVWALGLIAHELLTGELPMRDGGGRRVDPAVDAKWPGIAPILRRCLEPLPTERFTDAGALQAALAPKPVAAKRRRWPMFAALALAVASVATAFAIWRAGGGREPVMATTRLTVSQHPHSVAVSPDGARYAFAIGDALWVSELRTGAAGVQWPTPPGERGRKLATLWVAGWYADGSLGVIGRDREGDSSLIREWPDGKSQILYTDAQRFVASVTPSGDRAALAIADHGVKLVDAAGVRELRPFPVGDLVTAIAWSPDGTRLAMIRAPADWSPERIEVMPAAGSEPRTLWTGSLDRADQLLAWLDDDRLVFAHADDDGARLLAIDVAASTVVERADWRNEYVGAGSAGGGHLVVARGTAREVVMTSDKSAFTWRPLHDGKLVGRDVAGWTSDGKAVFANIVDGKRRIVRAAPGVATAPWPNTTASDVPDTLAGDRLIAHHTDGDKVVIDRIEPDGARRELARATIDRGTTNVVRCAGDRAAPCMIEEVDGTMVRWTEIDPETGARGKVIHERPRNGRHVRSAALSVDGAKFAVVDGSNLAVIVDRASGQLVTTYPHHHGVELQSVAFGDKLWATAIGLNGGLFGLMTINERALLTAGSFRTWLRWYFRPTESRDGKQLAAVVRDFDLDLWQIDGL